MFFFFTEIGIVSQKSKFSPTYLPYRLRSDFFKNKYREIHCIIFNCNFEAFVKSLSGNSRRMISEPFLDQNTPTQFFITYFWTTELISPSKSLNLVFWVSRVTKKKQKTFFSIQARNGVFCSFLYRGMAVINVSEFKGQSQLKIDQIKLLICRIFSLDL